MLAKSQKVDISHTFIVYNGTTVFVPALKLCIKVQNCISINSKTKLHFTLQLYVRGNMAQYMCFLCIVGR